MFYNMLRWLVVGPLDLLDSIVYCDFQHSVHAFLARQLDSQVRWTNELLTAPGLV